MATFSRRANGFWQAKIRRSGQPNQSKTFRTKTEAEKWARQVEAQMDAGHWTDVKPLQEWTLETLLNDYANAISPTHRSAAAELSRIKNVLRHKISEFRLDKLRAEHFDTYRDDRLREVSGSTVYKELTLLSSVFTYAIRKKHLPVKNILLEVERPKQNPARSRRAPDVELNKILNATQSPMLKVAIILARETAMRRAEIATLTWENVFLTSKPYVHLKKTKNGDERTPPLSKTAAALLTQLHNEANPKPQDRVCPMSPDSITQAFSRARERVAITDLNFHDIRHEATTQLSKKFKNSVALSKVTGHRDLRMLQRYYNPTPEELSDLLNAPD